VSEDDDVAAVFFANGLGDHLLTLPALRALSEVWPGRLTLLTADYPTELLLAGIDFARTVKVPMTVDADGRRSFDAALAAESLGPVKWLISLVPWHSTSVRDLIAAVAPARSVGLHCDFGWNVPVNTSMHAADRPFKVVRLFKRSAKLEDYTAPLDLPPSSSSLARRLRGALGAERRLLTVHAEASTPGKRWARMEAGLRRLLDDDPSLFVVELSHRAPCVDADKLGPSALSVSGIPLAMFLALIAESDIFLGVDSVGLHAADLWRVPAVGLFGPTDPAEFGFRFSDRNCTLNGNGDMANIHVDAVIDAVKSVTCAATGNCGQTPLHPLRR
jgi:ADP-heptose:LPS heptosyltransferase